MIGIIAGIILAGFIAFGVTEFNDEPSPSVAGFMEDVGIVGDYEPKTLSEVEIYKKLDRPGVQVYVVPGTYKVPRMHTVWDNTYESYCSPHKREVSVRPPSWDCQDYSSSTLEDMKGYAWGVAWSYGERGKRVGHMVNVGIVETYDGKLKILFYDPSGCFTTDPPLYTSHVVIGSGPIRVTEDSFSWEEI